MSAEYVCFRCKQPIKIGDEVAYVIGKDMIVPEPREMLEVLFEDGELRIEPPEHIGYINWSKVKDVIGRIIPIQTQKTGLIHAKELAPDDTIIWRLVK